jgi:chromosome segregation ATPase
MSHNPDTTDTLHQQIDHITKERDELLEALNDNSSYLPASSELSEALDKVGNLESQVDDLEKELDELKATYRVNSVYEELVLSHVMKNLHKIKLSDLEKIS